LDKLMVKVMKLKIFKLVK